jgi:hypothetical protein
MTDTDFNSSSPQMLGWREWAGLPELNIPLIKAKIDTGARTSSLHAFYIETFRKNNADYVRFGIHPKQRNFKIEKECIATMIDKRSVTDSGGHQEERIVICTPLLIGNRCWPVEITLTNRDTMRFRMLLGRTALAGSYHIDPKFSYLAGKPDAETYHQLLIQQGSPIIL